MEDNYTHGAHKAKVSSNRNKKLRDKGIVRESRIRDARVRVRSTIVALDEETVIDLRTVRRLRDIAAEE